MTAPETRDPLADQTFMRFLGWFDGVIEDLTAVREEIQKERLLYWSLPVEVRLSAEGGLGRAIEELRAVRFAPEDRDTTGRFLAFIKANSTKRDEPT